MGEKARLSKTKSRRHVKVHHMIQTNPSAKSEKQKGASLCMGGGVWEGEREDMSISRQPPVYCAWCIRAGVGVGEKAAGRSSTKARHPVNVSSHDTNGSICKEREAEGRIGMYVRWHVGGEKGRTC